MSKYEKVHKIITNFSLEDAYIELNIFMSVYYGFYCEKFDMYSFIVIKLILYKDARPV